MATINDFSDILSAMEQNPELQEALRNHVLGEELRQLPAVVQQHGDLLIQVQDRLMELASTLRDTTEQIAGYALVSSRVITTTVERLDRVESDLAVLKAAQARLEASVQEVREVQARMQNDVAELKADMTEVKTDVAELKADMTEVKTDVAELKADMTEVKTDVAELKNSQERMQATQERMQGQLNNLTGTDYERKVVKRAPRVARRYLGLRSASVVYGINVSGSSNMQALLDKATESRAITDEQADEVERADLILRGERANNEELFAIAEVSVTIDDSDIDRARDRANILNDASATPALAVVIGTAISDANRERASDSGVTVIIMGE